MTLRIRIQIISLIAVLVAFPNASRAELGEDTHIQETGEVRIEIDRQVFEEFARLFRLGYPPATVMMHAISTGMSINDIVYIAVKSDVSRAQEFYDTAESLLPALPGWVCQAGVDRERYTRAVDPAELGENPSIRRIADFYFTDNRRLVPFPDWEEGRVHTRASVAELADLISDEEWYVPGDDDGTPRTAPNRPIFISLYRHDQQIVVDSGTERIRQAQQQGVEWLPVVLVYNDSQQRPISEFGPDVTLRELADEFFGDGIEVTAVPEWKVKDHHKTATIDELREVVDVPLREDVLAERWDAVEQEIRANGMELPRPLLLTLVRSGRGRAWVNDPTTVAVAENLGIQSLPVVLFYHQIDRRPCGEPSTCEDLLCEAATAAGAPDGTCSSDEGQSNAQFGGPRESGESSLAISVDPRIYEGLSYSQNQCTS